MQNAHLRLGRLEYVRQTEVTNTRVSLHVDRYVGDGEQAHLVSVFGGDAEVGAIRAAIYEGHAFHLTFPNGTNKTVKLGADANCYNGSLSIGPKRAVRHLVAVSAALQANGSAGVTYLMHLDVETKELAWATVVSLLGVPADPRWGETVLGGMRGDKLIRRLDGIGCNPAIILGTRQELMDRVGGSAQSRSVGLSTGEWTDPLAALWYPQDFGDGEQVSHRPCGFCCMMRPKITPTELTIKQLPK
jgi:hypothetical protein